MLGAVFSFAQTGGQARTAAAPARTSVPQLPSAATTGAEAAAAHKATIDRYCVTCHSDRGKVANLSLQNLDAVNIDAE
jgi:mono/diheme cytochrome c family protein